MKDSQPTTRARPAPPESNARDEMRDLHFEVAMAIREARREWTKTRRLSPRTRHRLDRALTAWRSWASARD